MVFEIHYADRIGENYFLKPTDEHEWFYYPQMHRNEVIFICLHPLLALHLSEDSVFESIAYASLHLPAYVHTVRCMHSTLLLCCV